MPRPSSARTNGYLRSIRRLWVLALASLGCTGNIGPGAQDGNLTTAGDTTTGPQGPGMGPVPGEGTESAGVLAARHKFPRLTRQQLAKALEDVFGVRIGVESLLPQDDRGESGYVESYDVSSSGLLGLLEVAELAAHAALQPAARAQLCQSQGDSECVSQLSKGAAKRLYKRALTSAETQDLTTLFAKVEAEQPGDGLRAVLLALLVSPQFLFLIEQEQPALPGAQPPIVTGPEMAARLALLLSGSVPSLALLELADRGNLNTTEQVGEAARPLLASADFSASFQVLLGQWAYSERVAGIHPSAERYPDFDPASVVAFQSSLDDLLRRASAPGADLQKS